MEQNRRRNKWDNDDYVYRGLILNGMDQQGKSALMRLGKDAKEIQLFISVSLDGNAKTRHDEVAQGIWLWLDLLLILVVLDISIADWYLTRNLLREDKPLYSWFVKAGDCMCSSLIMELICPPHIVRHRGNSLKVFTNEHNCVACNKGKQHKASYKHISAVRLITESLQLLHMDLFGPTNIRSIDQKYYSLVVTDDFSRFRSEDEQSDRGFLHFLLNSCSEGALPDVVPDMVICVSQATAEILYSAVKGNSAGVCDSVVREPVGIVFADGVSPAGIASAGSDPAGGNPAGSSQPAGSDEPAGKGNPAVSTSVSADFIPVHADESTLPPGQPLGSSENTTRFPVPSDVCMDQLSSGIFTSSSYDDDFSATLTNLAPVVDVNPVPTRRVNTIHPQSQILGDLASPVLTRSRAQKSKFGESAFIGYIQDQQRTNHTDQLHCLFGCFLSQLEPTSIAKALEDPDWVAAMQEEMQQFINQQVWKLVPLPDGKHAIGTKWILKNKRDARGIVVRNKARLVAQGHRQEEGIDYDEVFAPVARIEAIRLFLAFASYMGFLVYQMDVKSAFLYGEIEEEVYVTQPKGFEDPFFPKHVYRVVKALYGLHQAPRAWYARLSAFLLQHNYRRGTIDKTLFIKKDSRDIILVQVYVDDIIFGSTNKAWCAEFEVLMKGEFEMSAMGEMTFFLGLQVKQLPDGTFISQDRYVKDMLTKFDMESVRTASTPYEAAKTKLKDETDPPVNVHLYRSMIGSLMYLTASRPDIMFAVSACSRHQVTPLTSHLNAVKKIFKYLKGQPKLGLWYPKDSPFQLEAYSDSDYAGSHGDRKSTTGGCQFLGRRLISWQCKKQTIVATSSTEAEYVAAASCCAQVLWIQNQLLDYGFNFMNTKIFIDNQSTICIVKNPVFHQRTKHIEIRHHFIRDANEKNLIQVLKIHTDDNVADLLTKAFDGPRFEYLVVHIGMVFAQGHRQEEGIDYDEVFAPVARIEAIRLFLAFASYMGFLVYQMDVKSAFLYGEIEEEVYVTQPKGFEDPYFPKHVYRVVKALYGLHQAPRAWYARLSAFLLQHNYRRGTIDKTLFIKKDSRDILLVQVYVDDIIFGSTNKAWCEEFEVLMKGEFEMSAMGEMNFFLGLQVKQLPDGIFISQDKYVKDMLTKFDMESVRTATTPYEAAKTKLKDETDPPVNVHLYRSMIGSLMYLTASRPDIMFAVSACSRHQVTPLTSHLNAVKKIFKYLKGQPKLGLWYPKDSPFQLEAYSDSDYAGSHGDRKSTTGGCQFLGRRLISWQCKKQTIVATSSTEAEYVAAASCCAQVLWIQNQLLDYGFNFMNTKIFIDNQSTICIVKNPVFHQRTKHIEIRHHFIRDANEKNLIQVLKVHTDDNVADLLTKAFDGPRFEYLVVHIGMVDMVLVSAGSYGLCWMSCSCWFRVHAGRHTSPGGFISADRVCIPAVCTVSAVVISAGSHLFMLSQLSFCCAQFDFAGWLVSATSHSVSAGSLHSCWCLNVSAE
ncbi:putative ribonuclease H-like domain-containing protein [Tanacetum coccineum]|uniref:Ribonuclease H-like domain-containing protein n=1 Tax=Tanacetum coccineum TaxID=301880 RepID=A0ABQ5HST4_9ASTR